MRMSERGLLDLVADEGEVLTAYKDVVGVWTIGVGLTSASGVIKPVAGMKIGKEESRRLLRLALERNYEPTVSKTMGPVKQHVFDGSTSFHFNTGAIARASWVSKFKAGAMAAARTSFLSWNKGGGRIIRGLELRRQREWATISTGKYHTGPAVVPTAPASPAQIDAAVERSVMKQGDRGPDVLKLQNNLSTLGYYTGPKDGDFGPLTDGAVRAFQKSHPHLVADGRAGTATLTTIQRMLDVKAKAVKTSGGGTAGTAAGGIINEAAKEQGFFMFSTLDVVLVIAVVSIALLVFLAWNYRDEISAMISKKEGR